MKYWRTLVLLLPTILVTQACFHDLTVSTTRRVHAANFGCAPSSIEVRSVQYDGYHNRGTFVANGCGVRQTYLCASNECAASGSAVRTSGDQRFVETGPGCDPPCSPGYACNAGVCRGVCNPLCREGFICGDDRVCHPR